MPTRRTDLVALPCLTRQLNQRPSPPFRPLQAKSEQGGPRVVRALLDLLLAEREHEWLRQVTEGESAGSGGQACGCPRCEGPMHGAWLRA